MIFVGEYLAVPENVSVIRQDFKNFIHELNLTESQTFMSLLVLGEATANVIEHAYDVCSGIVKVTFCKLLDTIKIIVEDYGVWKQRLQPRPSERGRGFKIVDSLCREVKIITKTTGGTIIAMEIDFLSSKW